MLVLTVLRSIPSVNLPNINIENWKQFLYCNDGGIYRTHVFLLHNDVYYCVGTCFVHALDETA